MTEAKKQPAKKFRAGGVTATIWENKSDKGVFYSIVFSRSYKDKEEWKETDSMRANDLPKLALVSSQAYAWVIQGETE